MDSIKQHMDDETRAYQEQTAKIRFKENLLRGIAGPMTFGLIFAMGTALLKVAGWSWGFPLLATGALAAMAVTGVVCLYLTSRLSSQLTRLEQDHQAKLITKGINGKSPELEPQKPVPFPSQDKGTDALDVAEASAKKETPRPVISGERELQDKVVDINSARMRTA